MAGLSSELDLDEFDVLSEFDAASEDRTGSLDIAVEGDEIVLAWIPLGHVKRRVEMIRFDRTRKMLRIFPRSIRGGRLERQFRQIEELQVAAPYWNPRYHSVESDRYGLLRAAGLPDGFNVFYAYGLGINRHYQDFVHSIEEHSDCKVLRFGHGRTEGALGDGRIFDVTFERFERYRSAVERNRGRARTAARRVNEAECHNAVADLFSLATAEVKYARNEVIRKLTEEVSTGYVTTTSDRSALVDQVSLAAPTVAREAPERFRKLRTDIELVTLETLIDQFEQDLAGSHATDEHHWQEFFDNNRFALQQLFSMPIVVVQPQAHVRGADVTGSGARIVDFLCANVVTRSAVIVEIKTPAASMMENKPYRGSGSAQVFALHKDLSGTIAQIQSQMVEVPRELSRTLSTRATDIVLDPWHDIRGAVIVGRVSSLSDEQRESFVRYRSALSNVTILGYDEVLERLKSLLVMLRE